MIKSSKLTGGDSHRRRYNPKFLRCPQHPVCSTSSVLCSAGLVGRPAAGEERPLWFPSFPTTPHASSRESRSSEALTWRG